MAYLLHHRFHKVQDSLHVMLLNGSIVSESYCHNIWKYRDSLIFSVNESFFFYGYYIYMFTLLYFYTYLYFPLVNHFNWSWKYFFAIFITFLSIKNLYFITRILGVSAQKLVFKKIGFTVKKLFFLLVVLQANTNPIISGRVNGTMGCSKCLNMLKKEWQQFNYES